MSHSNWTFAVTVAITWNIVITVLKFIWFLLTWSGAMFSEGIHSIADTMNQALLLVGLKKSSKVWDSKFEYGYWRERFFWAILSACGIFFIGAGVTIYHWVEALIHPVEIRESIYAYIIFGISGLIEASSLILAIKSIYNKKKWLLPSILMSDNATKAVIFEDSVAVGGIFIAVLSSYLVHLTWIIAIDAIGSILIGILLWCVAVILVLENKGYLIWKSMPKKMRDDIFNIIQGDSLIIKILDFRSEAIDLDRYVIKCDAEFNGTTLITDLNQYDTLEKEYETITNSNEFLRFCVDFSSRVPRIIGKRIDILEKEIKAKYPEVVYIDFEIN